VCTVIEGAARRAHDDAVPSREALLDALTTAGPAAVESLMRLAREREGERLEQAAILARLALVSGAGPALARLLEERPPPGDLAYRALLCLPAPEALPWLEGRCGSHRERALALETLASFPGTPPLASLLRLERAGRVPEDELVRLLVGLLERDPERGATFSEELVESHEVASVRGWLGLLIASAHPGAARALIPLVFCSDLAADERQWAALAIGELGAAEDGQRLCSALAPRAAEDGRRAAACIVSIHALLGTPGVEQVLEACSPANVVRVLDALDAGRAGAAVQLYRVERSLAGALAELTAPSTEERELL